MPVLYPTSRVYMGDEVVAAIHQDDKVWPYGGVPEWTPAAMVSLWAHSGALGGTDTGDSGAGLSLGTRVLFNVPGRVHAVWFQKALATSGTYTAGLWQQLDSSSDRWTEHQQSEVKSGVGWHRIAFPSPAEVFPANDIWNYGYVIGAHYPSGSFGYHAQANVFNGASVTSGPITAPAESTANNYTRNGRFIYDGASDAYPSSSFNSASYYVDLEFEPLTTAQTVWPFSHLIVAGNQFDSGAQVVGTRFRASVDGWVVGIKYFSYYNVNNYVAVGLYTNGGTLLAAAPPSAMLQRYGWAWKAFTTPVFVTAGTTYVAAGWYGSGTNVRYTDNLFTSAGVTSGNLTALQHGVDGANGCYLAGGSASLAFPATASPGTSFYMDAVFVPAS